VGGGSGKHEVEEGIEREGSTDKSGRKKHLCLGDLVVFLRKEWVFIRVEVTFGGGGGAGEAVGAPRRTVGGRSRGRALCRFP